MPEKQKWFLLYNGWDPSETMGNERYQGRIELKAESEEEAISEGREKWAEITSQRATYVGRPSRLDPAYPNSPKVVYEISID